MHATDIQPAPKPSRYRTIRGKNVPESRRAVEPVEPVVSAASVPYAVDPPSTSGGGSSSSDTTPPKRFPSRYLSRRSMAPAASQVSPQLVQHPALPSPQPPQVRHAPAPAPAPAPSAAAATSAASGNTSTSTSTRTPVPPFPPFQLQTSSLPQPPPTLHTLASPLTLVPLPRRDIYDDSSNDPMSPADDASARHLEEQKRLDLERLQKELAAASLAMSAEPARPAKSTSRDRFTLFSRRHKPAPPATLHKAPPSRSQPASPSPAAGPFANPHPQSHSSVPSPAPVVAHMPEKPQTIGEPGCRYVVVRCQQFSATISILPETTVADALDAAAPLLPAGLVDPAASVLVESYARIGLERRLRRYERIRSVMDSWDTDADNTFVIMRSGDATPTACRFGLAADLELDAAHRGRTPPAGFLAMQMHHSQKPGRWNKRYVSLLEDSGHMVASKKEDAEGHDLQSLCHLSDYDIYTPTEAQLKVLRPPKAYCFAIKSQQRTTVFVNTENYVHFFATDDLAVARLVYDKVFGWRSWYLAKTLPAVKDQDKDERRPSTAAARPSNEMQRERESPRENKDRSRPPVSLAMMKSGLQRSLSRRSAGGNEHTQRPTDESLFGGVGHADLSLGGERTERAERSEWLERMERAAEHERADARPSAQPPRERERERGRSERTDRGAYDAGVPTHRSRSVVREAKSSSRPASREDIPLGLQYPQLVQQQQQQQLQHHQSVGPGGSGGSSGLGGLGRSRSTRSTRGRAPTMLDTLAQAPPMPSPISTMPMPTPLVDLTPKFQEAPQWSKEGKGHGVRAPPGAHLVDLATDSNPNNPGKELDMLGYVPLRRDTQPVSSASASASQYPPPLSRAGRSQTMTSSSGAAAAASFKRSRSVAHHDSGRGGGGGARDAPPVPLLARIPHNNAGQVGEARGRSTSAARQ